MGARGINCMAGQEDTRILWDELSLSLPYQVSLLWLVGCKSQRCMQDWQGWTNPVRGHLLVTTKSRFFLPLVALFQNEISLDPIVPFDEIPKKLARANPSIAKDTQYYRVAHSFVSVS